jgi:hypothetical protein
MENGVVVLKLLMELCKEVSGAMWLRKKGVQRNELNNRTKNKVMN